MKQIVCLSTSNWHPYPTRKQQIMGRLKDAQILYFDPPVTFAAPLKDKGARSRISEYKGRGEKVTDSVTVYATPPVFPLYNRHRAINRLNQRRLAIYIRRIMEQNGFSDPILWVYSPMYADIVDLLPKKAVVYDCVDRHSAYPGQINPFIVDVMEADLVKNADFVFTTAQGLYDRLQPMNVRTALVPNGANFELFNKASRKDLPFPKDMFNIREPVFGFAGALQECIEYSFVEFAARRHMDWSFVFVGKPLPGVNTGGLKDLKNVHFLGLKPYKELPSYLARFDVCLNLFRSGGLAKDVSPLKFYEYLATGKPIISTPQPDQVLDYKDVILLAHNEREFEAQCIQAISGEDASVSEKRVEYGRSCSWDARAEVMERLLIEAGVF